MHLNVFTVSEDLLQNVHVHYDYYYFAQLKIFVDKTFDLIVEDTNRTEPLVLIIDLC